MPAVGADEPSPAGPNSEIRGKIVGTDGRPIAGIEVFAYHLATEALFTAKTGGKGEFRLTALPYGYFDMAAKSPAGLFVADQVANVAPGGTNVIDFRLLEFNASTQVDSRAFPGLDQDPIGIARVVDQRMVGEGFWRGPKGISIIAGTGALVLLAISGGSGKDASPTTP